MSWESAHWMEVCPWAPKIENRKSGFDTSQIDSLSLLIWNFFIQIFWPNGPWCSVPFWKIPISPARRSFVKWERFDWSVDRAGMKISRPARKTEGRLTDIRRLEVSGISSPDTGWLTLTGGLRNCLNLNHLSLRAEFRHLLQTCSNRNHH